MIRFLDILLSMTALFFIMPLLIFISIVLKLTGEGYVFYKQARIGLNGKEFKIIKFATMLKNSPSLGTKDITVQDDPRILPVGKFLRKTKLNELPQILNVVFNDMSLIGPRPLTKGGFMSYSERIQKGIKTCKPGLSGIGSIIFRNEEMLLSKTQDPVSFWKNTIAPYKGELELWYSKNISIFKYILLIFLTISVILFPKTKNLVFVFFKDLPKPNNKLKVYLSEI